MIPIRVSEENVAPLINRAYRESDYNQYIRELVQNALEARATRIEIMPEWQAVECLGAWRFMIADNGFGMTADQLERYLGQFGQGGKTIGGAHENFGIGAKSSTLPWNPNGVVIISYTADYPYGAMIWFRYNSELGMYGMRELSEDGEAVVEPYDDREGLSAIDWRTVAPDWVRSGTGTVVILLGGNETANTFWGKRGNDGLRDVRKYINTRFWEIAEGVAIRVTEANRREPLPRSYAEAFARLGTGWKACDTVAAVGAKAFALDEGGASGYVPLRDSTRVHWFLRAQRLGDDGGYRPRRGYVAALYRNELYCTSDVQQTFRAWGIADANVAKRLTLIVEPLLAGDSDGVFPSQARSTLLMQRGNGTTELPWDKWREEFRDKLPDEVLAALSDAAKTEDEDDERLLEIDRRLKERYSGENIADLKAKKRGSERVRPARGKGPQSPPGTPGPPKPRVIRPRKINLGKEPGRTPAEAEEKTESGLPGFTWVGADEMADDECRLAGVWTEPNASNPRGLITANRDFEPIGLLVKELQKLWPAAFAQRVEDTVLRELRTSLIAKVAEFRGNMTEFDWKGPEIRDALRNPATFTFAMVGFASEQDVIKRQLTDALGRPRRLRVITA